MTEAAISEANSTIATLITEVTGLDQKLLDGLSSAQSLVHGAQDQMKSNLMFPLELIGLSVNTYKTVMTSAKQANISIGGALLGSAKGAMAEVKPLFLSLRAYLSLKSVKVTRIQGTKNKLAKWDKRALRLPDGGLKTVETAVSKQYSLPLGKKYENESRKDFKEALEDFKSTKRAVSFQNGINKKTEFFANILSEIIAAYQLVKGSFAAIETALSISSEIMSISTKFISAKALHARTHAKKLLARCKFLVVSLGIGPKYAPLNHPVKVIFTVSKNKVERQFDTLAEYEDAMANPPT